MLKHWLYIVLLSLLPCTAMAVEIDAVSLEQAVAADPEDLRARLVLGRYYLMAGELEKAREQLEAVSKLDPDLPLTARLTRQLDGIHEFSDALTQIDLANPYDQARLEHVVNRLYNAQEYEQLDTLLDWLKAYDFKLPISVREIYAQRLLDHNRVDQALKLLEQAAGDERSPLLLRLRAKACHRLVRIDCAVHAYGQVWNAEQQLDDGLQLLALLVEKKDRDKAHMLLQQMQPQWPDHKRIAEFKVALDQQEKDSQRDLESAFHLSPGDITLRALVSSLYDNSQREMAIEVLDRYLAEFTPDNDTRYFAAERYAWETQYEKALALLSDIQPNTEKVQLLRARIHAWRGELDIAKPQLRHLIDTARNREILLQSRMMMGFSYYWGGDLATALTYFDPLMKIESSTLDYPAMQEVILLGNGDYDRLIELYETRLLQQPDNTDLMLQLANLFEQKKAYSQAQDYYEGYLKLRPDDHAVRKRLGLLYIEHHEYVRGFLHLERHAFQQYSADSLFQLAQQYYWSRRYTDAKRILDQLTHQFPGDTRSEKLGEQIQNEETGAPLAKNIRDPHQLELARKAFEADDFRSASAQLSVYLQQYPADMEAHYLYAFALAQQGQHTVAASEFYIVSRSYMNSDEVSYHYGYNLSRSGNYRAARTVLKKLALKLRETLEPSLQPVPDELQAFIESWQHSWQARDFSAYSKHYAPVYRDNARWIQHKSGLLESNKDIQVVLSELGVVKGASHAGGGMRYLVRFVQDYRSDRLNDQGLKHLLVDCGSKPETEANCLIQKESWKTLPDSEKSVEEQAYKQELLKQVEQELERLELAALEKSPQDTVVNTIYFGEGVGKVLRPEGEVLSRRVAVKVPSHPTAQFGLLARDLKAKRVSDEGIEEPEQFSFRYRAFSDSDDVKYRRPEVSVQKKWRDYQLQAALAAVEFRQPQCRNERGFQLDLNGRRDEITVGARLDNMRDQLHLMPYLRYQTQAKSVFTTWSMDYSSLFFDKLSCASLDRELTRLQLTYNQYRELGQKRSLWYAFALGRVSDDNIETIGQYDYAFYKGEMERLDYAAALNGWYIWNSQPTDDYYSPDFYDSSRVRLEATLDLGEELDLIANSSAGYTFTEKRALYDYGIWLKYPMVERGVDARVGCHKSNSGRTAQANRAYRSTNCTASLEYQW